MRFVALTCLALVLASPAAAATPRFGLFNLNSDLSKASRNEFGDLRLAKRPGTLHGVVVRCGAGCRFGSGWLAFSKQPSLNAGDVAGAEASLGRVGWSVHVQLTARGKSRWAAFSKAAVRHQRAQGVPDVFVVVVDGSVVAAPFASQVRAKDGSLELAGFHRADARRAAALLR
jgi:preprotein translocase subunit SecD